MRDGEMKVIEWERSAPAALKWNAYCYWTLVVESLLEVRDGSRF
jgi:hypothetical protein